MRFNPKVYLRAGQERRVQNGHPWVYSNEVRMDDEALALSPGTLVDLCRSDGQPLGIGAFNPRCLICFRMLAAKGEAVGRAFFAARLNRALDLRRKLFDAPYYRLVHGEADSLPGLVVDRFGDVLSVQTSTMGMENLLPEILAALDETCAPKAIALCNGGAFRELEGLERYVRMAKGSLDQQVCAREGKLSFLADPLGGQKTGWFYDQRDNRAFVASLCRDARVLDVYCYAGGFAISAAAAGARQVLAVDSSESALDLAAKAAKINGAGQRCSFTRGDAFEALERLGGEGERFDVVCVDPPAFVKSRKDLKPGLKGYRKLARVSAKVVAPCGFLFMASCSHNVSASDFLEEVTSGVSRQGRIIRLAGAAPDHPVHPKLPESAYLKALVMQLD